MVVMAAPASEAVAASTGIASSCEGARLAESLSVGPMGWPATPALLHTAVRVLACTCLQFDLGEVVTSVQALRIRGSDNWGTYYAGNMEVYMSETTDFAAGTLVASGLYFSSYESKYLAVPAGLAARYVTLRRPGAWAYLAVAEVAILATREWAAQGSSKLTVCAMHARAMHAAIGLTGCAEHKHCHGIVGPCWPG